MKRNRNRAAFMVAWISTGDVVLLIKRYVSGGRRRLWLACPQNHVGTQEKEPSPHHCLSHCRLSMSVLVGYKDTLHLPTAYIITCKTLL